jgi:hypothetical protein
MTSPYNQKEITMKKIMLPALMALFTIGSGTVHAKENLNVDLAPAEYETTGFDFKDCNGKTFNTKNQKHLQASNLKCVYQGIIATKFNVNGVQKSISEMTVSELDIFRGTELEERALFALGFYDTMHSPEFIDQTFPYGD